MLLDGLFSQIFAMSLSASIVILFVLLIRLLLRRAPSVFSYVLWSVVLVRLLCPWSYVSALSIIPDMAAISAASPETDASVEEAQPSVGTGAITQMQEQIPVEDPDHTAGRVLVTLLWLGGAAGMLTCGLVSLLRLRKTLVGAGRVRDNIFIVDHLPTPFVLGLFRPKIYLPSDLPESEQHYIILHEQTHIQRHDHLVKIIAFFALSIHWFNPLIWLSFVLAMRDMEMSCDEAVIEQMEQDPQSSFRQEYCTSLLNLTAGSRVFAGTPLAFGEGNPKHRIQNILAYRKPVRRVVLFGLLLCIIAALSLSTKRVDADLDAAVSAALVDPGTENCFLAPYSILDTETDGSTVTVYMLVKYSGYEFQNGDFANAGGTQLSPARMRFSVDGDGTYTYLDYAEPLDGHSKKQSTREMFPGHLYAIPLSAALLEPVFAAREWLGVITYLHSIDRSARIRDLYTHVPLSDLGVSEEVCGLLFDGDLLCDYPKWIGSREWRTDGIQYVYTTDYDDAAHIISFVKTIYGTDQIVESYYFDALTGAELTESPSI